MRSVANESVLGWTKQQRGIRVVYFYIHYDYELRNTFKNSVLKFHKTINLFLLVVPYFPPQTVIYTGHVNGEPQNPKKRTWKMYIYYNHWCCHWWSRAESDWVLFYPFKPFCFHHTYSRLDDAKLSCIFVAATLAGTMNVRKKGWLRLMKAEWNKLLHWKEDGVMNCHVMRKKKITLLDLFCDLQIDIHQKKPFPIIKRHMANNNKKRLSHTHTVTQAHANNIKATTPPTASRTTVDQLLDLNLWWIKSN